MSDVVQLDFKALIKMMDEKDIFSHDKGVTIEDNDCLKIIYDTLEDKNGKKRKVLLFKSSRDYKREKKENSVTISKVLNPHAFYKHADCLLLFFYGIDFSYDIINALQQYELFFQQCIFKDEIKIIAPEDIETMSLNQSLKCIECVFEQRVEFKKITSKKELSFEACIFKGKALFVESFFYKTVRFDSSLFEETGSFVKSVFNDFVRFNSARFHRGMFEFVKVNFFVFFQSCILDDKRFAFNGISMGKNKKSTFDTIEDNYKSIKDQNKKDDEAMEMMRDTARKIKSTFLAQHNIIEASYWNKIELYCREIELRHKQKPNLSDWIEKIQLGFYRYISDHHTDLLKIINNTIILIALMGCFSLYLLLAKLPKNEEEKMWITSFSGFPLQYNFITMERGENTYYLPQTNIDGSLNFLLDKLHKFHSADIVLYSFVLFVFIWLVIQMPRSIKKKVYSFCVVVGLACLFYFACKNLVWLKAWMSFFAILLCFVTIYSLLLLLRNYWLRWVVVVLSYCICICMLIAKPALLLPIFGKFIDETLKIDYPLMTSLGVIYSILMFLMLFSLQKTARKNSIVPN